MYERVYVCMGECRYTYGNIMYVATFIYIVMIMHEPTVIYHM